jgi:hypothetical protein
MHRPTAICAVEYEITEASFEVGLHLQQLKPQHLRLQGDGVRSVEASLECLIDDCTRRVVSAVTIKTLGESHSE